MDSPNGLWQHTKKSQELQKLPFTSVLISWKVKSKCQSCFSRPCCLLCLSSPLSVVFLSRGSCQLFLHITCLKSRNGLVVFVRNLEVVHKQVRSCLISYNLQLRKLEVIWPNPRIAASIPLKRPNSELLKEVMWWVPRVGIELLG